MLSAGKKALAFCQVVDLFLSGPLRDLSDFIHLVLGLIYSALIDASVIVLVNTSEVRCKLLVKDIWSQVPLPLNERQVVLVVRPDGLMHLVQETMGRIHTISNARDQTNKYNVVEHMTLDRCTGCHSFHANFLKTISLRLFNLLQLLDNLHGFVRQLPLVQLLIHELLEDDHVTVARDKAIVDSTRHILSCNLY